MKSRRKRKEKKEKLVKLGRRKRKRKTRKETCEGIKGKREVTQKAEGSGTASQRESICPNSSMVLHQDQDLDLIQV